MENGQKWRKQKVSNSTLTKLMATAAVLESAAATITQDDE